MNKIKFNKREKKNIPAKRIRTTDLRITVSVCLYSPPLYQLSYHGILTEWISEGYEAKPHRKRLNFTAAYAAGNAPGASLAGKKQSVWRQDRLGVINRGWAVSGIEDSRDIRSMSLFYKLFPVSMADIHEVENRHAIVWKRTERGRIECFIFAMTYIVWVMAPIILCAAFLC